MRRIKYHGTKRKTAVKWITVVLVFLIIPLETRWILTGAMAVNSTPLEQNLEDFRSFELPVEEENDSVLYDIVEDEEELRIISKYFEELLEDVELS